MHSVISWVSEWERERVSEWVSEWVCVVCVCVCVCVCVKPCRSLSRQSSAVHCCILLVVPSFPFLHSDCFSIVKHMKCWISSSEMSSVSYTCIRPGSLLSIQWSTDFWLTPLLLIYMALACLSLNSQSSFKIVPLHLYWLSHVKQVH